MAGETNLSVLLREMKPLLNAGEYVFCTVSDIEEIDWRKAVCMFRETEGITLIIEKALADKLQLSYRCIFSWITLSVHSSLEAVGLTAAVSAALTNENISCNVVAANYHDHLFVALKDADKTMKILQDLATRHEQLK